MHEKEIVADWILNYFSSVWHKISENLVRNLILIFFEIVIIIAMVKTIVPFGNLTVVSYIIACIYGLSKIIDSPYLPVVWGVGFVICSTAVKLIFSSLIPIIKEGTAVSIFSAAVILYVILALYFKGKELRDAE